MKRRLVSVTIIVLIIQMFIVNAFAAQTASISDVKTTVNTSEKNVTIQGVISSGSGKNVTIMVKSPSGNLDYVGQIESKDGGEFVFTYTPYEFVEGEYSVKIGGEDVDTPYEGSFNITTGAGGGSNNPAPGGGGGAPYVPPADETKEQPKEEPKEETKEEPEEKPEEKPVEEKPEETKVTFNDISSVPWAKEAIETLAAEGIISGPGDGTFRPNNKVTRAEFIKMLMMALELVDEEAVCTFSDVKEGAWYYQSIANAEKLGIVNGKGDGTFGVNDEILRQDMAVMIYRAAQLTGIDLGDDINVIPFTDEEDISGYAKEAVAAIQKAGIINGIGDGSFAPKKNATRAEAAVIIYRLLNKTI